MVPHSVVTVSLATAMLPRLSRHAADDDLTGVATSVASTLRTAYAMILPFVLLLPLVATPVSNLIYGWGAGSRSVPAFAASLTLFAPGLFFFTAHYLMLRGFYSLERTRTVFWVQCAIAATNVGLAVLLTRSTDPSDTAPGLVLAYGGSYLVGAACSYALLRHLLGGLRTPALARFLVRMVIAAGAATVVAWAVRYGVEQLWPHGSSKAYSIVLLGAVGLADLGVFLVLARALRIREVTGVLEVVTSRLGR
jgi:putative peptidoglycan lipid II flippase